MEEDMQRLHTCREAGSCGRFKTNENGEIQCPVQTNDIFYGRTVSVLLSMTSLVLL